MAKKLVSSNENPMRRLVAASALAMVLMLPRAGAAQQATPPAAPAATPQATAPNPRATFPALPKSPPPATTYVAPPAAAAKPAAPQGGAGSPLAGQMQGGSKATQK